MLKTCANENSLEKERETQKEEDAMEAICLSEEKTLGAKQYLQNYLGSEK